MKTKKTLNHSKKPPVTPQVRDGLYNVAVFWPEALSFLVGRTLRTYQKQTSIAPTAHAKDRIRQYGLPVNCYKNVLAGTVVEATVANGSVHKIVARCPSAEENGVDWCAVICFEGKKVVIIAMWCNNQHDQHKTLKSDRYIH